MNEPLPTNDTNLDQCLSEIIDHGKTVDDCLATNPESAAEEPLLRLAARLRAAGSHEAPPDFHLSACERLEKRITAYASQPAPQRAAWPTEPPAARPPRTPRWPIPALRRPFARAAWVRAAGLAILVLFLLASTTTGYARRAVPGEPLYPVKLASEQVQLSLAASPAQHAELHLAFAGRRFEELSTLISEKKTAHLSEAVSSYKREIDATYTYTQCQYLTPEDRSALVKELAHQLAFHQQQIDSILSNLDEARSEIPNDTYVHIREDITPAANAIRSMFGTLAEDIRQDGDLLREFQDLSEFEYFVKPSPTNQARTPSPHATSTLVQQTPVPGNVEEVVSESPSPVASDWPTQWITDWATLVPGILTTPQPGLLETILPPPLQEIVPTYLPTYLPTYFPPDDPEDSGNTGGEEDGESSDWDWSDDWSDDWPDDWPDDFPDESPDEAEGSPMCWGCP